jgi:hypothetical protein
LNRVTVTLDKHGHFVRICVDEAVEVLIIAPDVPQDRVYRWNSLQGREGRLSAGPAAL